jgi:hypothetical protein
MAEPFSVEAGVRTITIKGSGSHNETIKIVVRKGGKQVAKVSTKLDANGKGTDVLILDAGTYDVTITAPWPHGTVHANPPQIVQDGPLPFTVTLGQQPPAVTSVLQDGNSKLAPNVKADTGTLTVEGTGQPGEAIQIVITNQDGTPVPDMPFSGNLDSDGSGTVTFTLPQGTFDVEVTAPFPGGTVYDFLGRQVG